MIVASYGLWPLMVSIAQTALSGRGGARGVNLHATNAANLLLFAGKTTLTMGAIGVRAAAAIALRKIPPTGYLVGGAASLLAGLIFPTLHLQSRLQALSWCLPLTHALRGLRSAVDGEALTADWSDAIWQATAAAILFPLSFTVSHAVIEPARIDGTLAKY